MPPCRSREVCGFDALGLALRAHDDLLDAQARGFELGLAMGPQRRAALVHLDGALERGLARLQLGHDLLELGQGLLETEAGKIGGRCSRVAHRASVELPSNIGEPRGDAIAVTAELSPVRTTGWTSTCSRAP